MNEAFLVMLLIGLAVPVYQWLLLAVLTKRRVRLRDLMLTLPLYLTTTLLSSLIDMSSMRGLALALVAVQYVLTLLLVYRRRGYRLVLESLLLFTIPTLVDLGCAMVFSLLGVQDSEMLQRSAIVQWLTIPLFGVFFGLAIGIILLVRQARRFFVARPTVFRVLRLSLILPITLFYYLVSLQMDWRLPLYVISNVSFALMVLLAITFIYQDIRYIQQARFNETVQQKQKTIDELLLSMRSFRHNIGNLLYGMEGTFLSGNREELQSYYRQMTEKCAAINSENVVALQNIPQSALSALVLRKLNDATRQAIPFFLYADAKLVLNRLSQSDLCEIVGALLDNALEATQLSPAPYVSLELRVIQGGVELVVRNSFADDLPLEELLSASHKPAHEGLGVYSARQIVSRYPNSRLNYRQVGRYVEAQLLIV